MTNITRVMLRANKYINSSGISSFFIWKLFHIPEVIIPMEVQTEEMKLSFCVSFIPFFFLSNSKIAPGAPSVV
jgi:hypothetical protein